MEAKLQKLDRARTPERLPARTTVKVRRGVGLGRRTAADSLVRGLCWRFFRGRALRGRLRSRCPTRSVCRRSGGSSRYAGGVGWWHGRRRCIRRVVFFPGAARHYCGGKNRRDDRAPTESHSHSHLPSMFSYAAPRKNRCARRPALMSCVDVAKVPPMNATNPIWPISAWRPLLHGR
jgi:hypothetical protein